MYLYILKAQHLTRVRLITGDCQWSLFHAC